MGKPPALRDGLPSQACNETAIDGGRQGAAGTLDSQEILADTVGHGAVEAGARVDSILQEESEGFDLVVVGSPDQRVLADQLVHAAHVVVQHGEHPVSQTAAALPERCHGAELAVFQKVAQNLLDEFGREVLNRGRSRRHLAVLPALSWRCVKGKVQVQEMEERSNSRQVAAWNSGNVQQRLLMAPPALHCWDRHGRQPGCLATAGPSWNSSSPRQHNLWKTTPPTASTRKPPNTQDMSSQDDTGIPLGHAPDGTGYKLLELPPELLDLLESHDPPT